MNGKDDKNHKIVTDENGVKRCSGCGETVKTFTEWATVSVPDVLEGMYKELAEAVDDSNTLETKLVHESQMWLSLLSYLHAFEVVSEDDLVEWAGTSGLLLKGLRSAVAKVIDGSKSRTSTHGEVDLGDGTLLRAIKIGVNDPIPDELPDEIKQELLEWQLNKTKIGEIKH